MAKPVRADLENAGPAVSKADDTAQNDGSDAKARQQFVAAHRAADATQYHLGHVKLRRRVAAALEQTGVGPAIVTLDGVLSVVSVASYIASTYDTNSVYQRAQLNLALSLALYFLFCWFLGFWLSEDKLRFTFSLNTLVDVATTLPTFLAYGGLDIPGLLFLRCLRMLRLLRVFRVASSEQLANEVFFAAVMLGFTLVCMLIIAAAVFFELETAYGSTYVELQFHEALYWAAVTITTVGYGDYSPSLWETQLLLLLLLFVSFTILPYLSGKVVDAFNNTSKYERARYKPAFHTDVPHVVMLGSLDQHNMRNITAEMYHADKEFDSRHTVFLGPDLPTTAMKRVFMATPRYERLVYLQGSPLDSQDLQRAAIEHAEAVFIVCNKFASEPATEDRLMLMILLTVGQYLQERAVVLAAQHARSTWRRCLGALFPSLVPSKALPRLFVQLLLPESGQRMQHVLTSLRQPGSNEAVEVTATTESDQQPETNRRTHKSRKDRTLLDSLGLPYADAFWNGIHQQLKIICLSELRHSFLGHSALGVPGVIPLLCNLTTTLDYADALKDECSGPLWLCHYMMGASQEIYQLVAFPECLIGMAFAEAAAFIYDFSETVLIATDEAGADAGQNSISIAPLDAVITRNLCGYVIAPNAVSVLKAIFAKHNHLQAWRDGLIAPPAATSGKLVHDISMGSAFNGSAMKGHKAAEEPAVRPDIEAPVALVSPDAILHEPLQQQQQQQQGHAAGTTAGKNEPPVAFLPIYMLRTGSREQRAAADRAVEEHYHVVPRKGAQGPGTGAVDSMILQNVSFSGHILIVGVPQSLECLFSLMAPLRSQHLSAWRPIVILGRSLPEPGTEWDDIARLKDVFYVQGTVSNTSDLLRANAEGAAKAIILPALVRDYEGGAPHIQVALGDEVVVNAYQQLRAINAGIEIYTELMNPGDMAFLRPSQPVPGIDILQESLAPAYVSGQVFQPGIIDTLMAQTFYTRGSDSIVLRLLNQWHLGSAVTSFILDAKQHAKHAEPDELTAAQQKTPMVPARTPTVLQVPVAEECLGWPYRAYWLYMLQHKGMLLLGLYRPVVQQGRSFCVVLTNPDKDLELETGDRAFVIYDMSTSQQLPPEVLGFDHDLPPSGQEGRGGPTIMGSAPARAGSARTS